MTAMTIPRDDGGTLRLVDVEPQPWAWELAATVNQVLDMLGVTDWRDWKLRDQTGGSET
jgi:hypothetical protein